MLGKLIIVLLTLISLTKPIKGNNETAKTSWSVRDALSLKLKTFNGIWITDEEFYYRERKGKYYKYNAKTGKSSDFSRNLNSAYASNFEIISLSQDMNLVLIKYDTLEELSKYDIFDMTTNEKKSIQNGERIQKVYLSPINNRFAYKSNNNIYITFEDGLEGMLTNDGTEKGMLYGNIGWWLDPAISDTLWWSPDGLTLALSKHDIRKVREMPYIYYGYEPYFKTIRKKYPKPGTPNGEISLLLFDLSNSQKKKFIPKIITGPENILEKESILYNLIWIDNENFLVFWMNRRQKILLIQMCNKDNCKDVQRIEESDGWIKIGNVVSCPRTTLCYFQYWIGDWHQIWQLNLQTGNNTMRPMGNFTVTNFYGVDAATGTLYFQATLPGNPWVVNVFRNRDCLSCALVDVQNKTCQTASASFSKNYSFCAITCEGPGPTYVQIIQTRTKRLIRQWESNEYVQRMLESKLYPSQIFMNITLRDGSNGTAVIMFPPNLDKTIKYPAIIECYNGPDTVSVRNKFLTPFELFVTTYLTTVYIKIDGHGAGDQGKNILFSVKDNLGNLEYYDIFYATMYLQQLYAFIDPLRICLFGKGYGGYIVGYTLARDRRTLFKCGISISSISSFFHYYSGYSERYLSDPSNDTSLLNYTKYTENHDLLLMHGTADENVHYQSFLQLISAYYKKNINLEQLSFLDEGHNLEGVQRSIFYKIMSFLIYTFNL